jgi:hypothetical protein
MSQALISASEKSVTLSKMVSMNKVVPYYQPSPAMDALGSLFTKVNPSIGIAALTNIENQSVTWTLPSAGSMADMRIAFSCRMNSTAMVRTQLIAFDMVRNFEIISNGVPIISKSGAALKCQVKTLRELGHASFALRHAMYLDEFDDPLDAAPGAANTTWYTYLPCIETFLSAPEKSLLLNKCRLEVRITFASTAEMGVPAAVQFVGAPQIIIKSSMPKLSTYNEIVTHDWSKQFSFDCINTYVEPVPLSTATTVARYQITCPYNAIKTHFLVQRVTADTTGCPSYKVHTIDMDLGGVKFLDNMKVSNVISNDAKYGTLGVSVYSNFQTSLATTAAPATAAVFAPNGLIGYSNDILTIDWGITGSRGGAYGVNFWAENQGSTVTLTFKTVGANPEQCMLYIVHEYVQLVDWVPGSGGRGFLQVTSNN